MPHPRPHNHDDLPEYPVRPYRARRPTGGGRRPVTVWQRFPLGSRLVAVLAGTLLVGALVGAVRGPSHDAASDRLVVDASAESVDGGLGPDPTAVAAAALADAAASGPVAAGAFVEGTLPPTAGTPPSNAPSAARVASPVTTRPASAQVVKPAATATTAARPTTTAKAVVKPAATTRATAKATTAPKAVVKPPTSATTPRTTRAPATTTTLPKKTWTTDEVQALIRQIWPADLVDKALQVANTESRFRFDAYNGWCCYGVFQINGSAHLWRLQARGLGISGLLDAEVNIRIALEIYQDSGWGPWGG